MTAQPSAPVNHRQWNQTKPLNHHTRDFTTESGVRVSNPVYVDLTTTQRKDLLNLIRTRCYETIDVTQQETQSGIRTVSSANRQGEIEGYLGMSLDVLRTVIFARGGLEVSLLLRLQSVAGFEVITTKELMAGLKAKQDLIKAYVTENKFDA
jgi:hypothetical protein